VPLDLGAIVVHLRFGSYAVLGTILLACELHAPGPVIDPGSSLEAGLRDTDPRASDTDAGVSEPASADAATLFVAEPTCGQACAAARPDSGRSIALDGPVRCENVSVATCQAHCAERVRDTDAMCGRCLVEAMTWRDVTGGCGSWECSCVGGRPSFPGLHEPVCAAACESTLQRQAAQRLAAPMPLATGHLPDLSRELSELGALQDVATGGGAAWIAGWSTGGVVRVARLDSDLTVLASYEEPTQLPPPARTALRGTSGGDVVALFSSGEAATLTRLDIDAGLSFRSVLSQADEVPVFYAPGADRAGRLLVLQGDLTLSIVDPIGGEVLARARGPELGSFRPDAYSSRTFASAGEARLVLSGSGEGGPSLAILRLVGSASVPLLEQVALVPVRAEAPRRADTQTKAVVVDAAGFITIGGSAYFEKTSPGRSISYGGPFVARYDPSGTLLWEWEYDSDTVIPGAVEALALDAQGNVYSIGTEDPVSSQFAAPSTKCTVYGCDGLAVHKLSPTGDLLWSYQHQSARSSGAGIAVDVDSQVWAVGTIKREEQTGVVLRFAPE
jgi:outer membrane protein assembly factor BamB